MLLLAFHWGGVVLAWNLSMVVGLFVRFAMVFMIFLAS
jgi:hypothetical protein